MSGDEGVEMQSAETGEKVTLEVDKQGLDGLLDKYRSIVRKISESAVGPRKVDFSDDQNVVNDIRNRDKMGVYRDVFKVLGMEDQSNKIMQEESERVKKEPAF